MIQKGSLFTAFFLSYGLSVIALGHCPEKILKECCGWSVDVGGQYTWMSLTVPSTYSGSTGGFHSRITYQKPESIYGQIRTIHSQGSSQRPSNASHIYDWYDELVVVSR